VRVGETTLSPTRLEKVQDGLFNTLLRTRTAMIDTETFIRALQERQPDILADNDAARRAVESVFAVLGRALVNHQSVRIHGIGDFRVETLRGVKTVLFSPASGIVDLING
jgi:nucleoid DNA-binding protein